MKTEKITKVPHALRKNPHARELWMEGKRAGRPKQKWEDGKWHLETKQSST